MTRASILLVCVHQFEIVVVSGATVFLSSAAVKKVDCDADGEYQHKQDCHWLFATNLVRIFSFDSTEVSRIMQILIKLHYFKKRPLTVFTSSHLFIGSKQVGKFWSWSTQQASFMSAITLTFTRKNPCYKWFLFGQCGWRGGTKNRSCHELHKRFD